MQLRIARNLIAITILPGVLAATNVCAQPSASTASPARQTISWPTADGTVTLQNFRFGTGESLPELRLHYITLGTPHRNAAGHTDNAILLLHGTGGNAHSLMNPVFSNVLFGPGQPLDIKKYFLILPDDIGHGQSSKPSDGLHAHFPAYDYDDMVRSQRMMLDEMKIDHLRLILGTSMGCMQSFVWGETYPGFADALAPFACLPVQIAGRNRMMRYMIIEAIKQDPAWMSGEYKTEPRQGIHNADELSFVMGSSPLHLQKYRAHAPASRAIHRQLSGARRCRQRRKRHDFLLQRQPQLRSEPEPGAHYSARVVDQLRGRLHQSAGAGDCRKNGEAHAECALYFAAHFRCNAWTRYAHCGCSVERLSGGVHARH